jgi:hypothetical protein
MELIDGDVDYAFYLTMYEVLEDVIVHCDAAQHCENDVMLDFHIKMASRAMRCALQIQLDRLVAKRAETEEVK